MEGQGAADTRAGTEMAREARVSNQNRKQDVMNLMGCYNKTERFSLFRLSIKLDDVPQATSPTAHPFLGHICRSKVNISVVSNVIC